MIDTLNTNETIINKLQEIQIFLNIDMCMKFPSKTTRDSIKKHIEIEISKLCNDFNVICDRTNNTYDIIENGSVIACVSWKIYNDNNTYSYDVIIGNPI